MNYVREYWERISSGEIVTSKRVKAVYGRLVAEMDAADESSPYYFDEATVHGFYPSARDDFAGGNPLPIFPDVVHYLPDRAAGFVIKLISSSPADFFSFSGSNATSWFVRAEKDLIVVL